MELAMKTHQTPPEPNFGQTPGAAGSRLPGGRAEKIRPRTAGSRHWQLFAIGQAVGWSQVAVVFTAAAVSRGQSATQVLWVVTANIVVGVVVSTMLAIMLGRLHWGRLSTAKLLPLCLVALILATVAHLIDGLAVVRFGADQRFQRGGARSLVLCRLCGTDGRRRL